MKTLYLMRHGQTEFNLKRRIQGWCDSPLTTLGINQARIASEYFTKNNIVFDHAYSSTSERASDTLELITSMPYTRVKGLKEWHFGKMEGESEDLNPPLPYGSFFKDYYGGEHEMEVRERMNATLSEIMKRDDHQTVLAVSHAASCRGFMRYWEQNQRVEMKDKRLNNCCILKFEFDNDEFSLVELINHDLSSLQ